MPIWFALALAASPEVWVTTEGYDQACDAHALAVAISAQRPHTPVREYHALNRERPPQNVIRVRLVRGVTGDSLELSGALRSSVRQLPSSVECERSVETAALIVDGALDELTASQETLEVDSLLPWQKHAELALDVSIGAVRAPFGVEPSLEIELMGRYQLLQLALAVGSALPSNSIFFQLAPEAGQAQYTATPLLLELRAGPSFALGPGRLTPIEAAIGTTFWFGSESGAQQSGLSAANDFFVGARASYIVDLTRHFQLGLQFEERYAFQNATIVATGVTPVKTQTWIWAPSALLGWRFF